MKKAEAIILLTFVVLKFAYNIAGYFFDFQSESIKTFFSIGVDIFFMYAAIRLVMLLQKNKNTSK